jgi:hypothetical protein
MISTLLALALVVLLPLALPLLLIGLVLRLVLLPLKIVGFALRLVFKLVFGVFGLVFGVFGLVLALLAVGGFVLLLPLLPVLFVAAGIWLVARAFRPRPAMLAVARRA